MDKTSKNNIEEYRRLKLLIHTAPILSEKSLLKEIEDFGKDEENRRYYKKLKKRFLVHRKIHKEHFPLGIAPAHWTESQTPLVSVIVPNYCHAPYLKERIECILNQTFQNFELILLDDCSTDNSPEILLSYKNHPKVSHVVINEKNSGKAMRQWRKGFELAEGDYVWIAEVDDLSSRNFLAEVMKGFDDPKVVISYAESAIINSFGLMIIPNFRWSRDKEKTGHYKRSYVNDGNKEIEEIMAIRCTIPNVSGAVFKNDKKFLKYFDKAIDFSQAGDWYFYAKVLENGKIAYNRKSLNKFRIHSSSKTSRSKKDRIHFDEVVLMHEYFNKNYNLKSNVKKAIKAEESRTKEKHGIIE